MTGAGWIWACCGALESALVEGMRQGNLLCDFGLIAYPLWAIHPSSMKGEDDVDKGNFAEQSAVMPDSYETPEQELLNDSLEKLSDDEANFLRRVVRHGEATKLAKEHNVSNKTINTWKNKIIKKIKNS